MQSIYHHPSLHDAYWHYDVIPWLQWNIDEHFWDKSIACGGFILNGKSWTKYTVLIGCLWLSSSKNLLGCDTVSYTEKAKVCA